MFSGKIQHVYEKILMSETKWNKLLKGIVKIGEISFGIYLIHYYFLNLFVTRVTDLFILKIILTLAMSVVTIFLVKKVMPLLSKIILGFR